MLLQSLHPSTHTHTLTSTVFMKFCCPNNWILSFSCAFSPFLHLIIHNCDIVYEIRNKCIDIGVLWLVGGFILLHVPLPIVIHNESASFNENRHRIYYTVLVLLFFRLSLALLFPSCFRLNWNAKYIQRVSVRALQNDIDPICFDVFIHFFFAFANMLYAFSASSVSGLIEMWVCTIYFCVFALDVFCRLFLPLHMIPFLTDTNNAALHLSHYTGGWWQIQIQRVNISLFDGENNIHFPFSFLRGCTYSKQ